MLKSIKSFKINHPKLIKWVSDRLDPNYKYGRLLTGGVLVSSLFVFFFFSVIQDIFAKDPLALADVRITNLFVLFRTASNSRLMLYFTYIGKWQLVVLGAVLASIVLFLIGKRKELYALVVSVAGGQLLVTLLKYVINRQRPAIANAVIIETSSSFPSGHAFVVFSFYLLALFILWKLVKNKLARVGMVIAGALITFFIPISRIYLGVHWTSDVLGSIFLGIAWLSLFVTYLLAQEKFGEKATKLIVSKNWIKVTMACFLLFWVGFSVYYYNKYSYEKVVASKTVTLSTVAISVSDIPDKLFSNLPRTSEGLTGNAMEPINFIFVGSRNQMDTAFTNAGWLPVDSINVRTTWKIAFSTLFDKPYTTAPGTPSFWDFRPNDFAYERPRASVREREHIHIWTTPYIVDGGPLWLGTAHFDRSVKLTTNFIPTHEIDPLVDNERDSLMKQLSATGLIMSSKEVKIVDLTQGKNLAGSVFYTDGNGYLVVLR